MSIPKIIHQIWLGPNKKPDIWMKSWYDDYIQAYPDWTYKLWTEKEINKLKLVNLKQYNYEPFYNGKSDIARYEILFRYGGVFIDADSLWIKDNNISLDKILQMKLVLEQGMFAAEEPINKWSIANGVIGFTKGHFILRQLIIFIHKNYFFMKIIKKLNKQKQVWQVTGPKIFTDILKHNKLKALESFHFYPESFHQNNLDIDTSKFHELYPKSIMFQYGYSTNNISKNNIMKDYIDNISK